jgi:uncharacterized protein (TIGR00369 family)
MPVMNEAALQAFLAREFPQIEGLKLTIEAVGDNYARVRMPVDGSQLRPGGTVSGPTMFALADVSVYIAILAMIGPVALAVTTNLAINFLRKPGLGDMLAEVRLLKLGQRLAVGEVHLFSEGSDEPVAQVTATYSIPPRNN